jgi:hypothetical protein
MNPVNPFSARHGLVSVIVMASSRQPGGSHDKSEASVVPLVKIKRVKNGYRVYKLVNGSYKSKGTFMTMHRAKRYVKGFGGEANQLIAFTDRKTSERTTSLS